MVGLSLVPYERELLDGMIALYNAETAFEPFIVPLTPERFTMFVESKPYFDPAGLLVATEGEVVGWVHACRAPGTEPWHDPARVIPRIEMLVFPRDRSQVGAALVQAATAYLESIRPEGETTAIEAMHPGGGYPFYRGLWMGGEPMGLATLPHVHMAFEVGGYKTTFESVFLTARIDFAPVSRDPDIAVEFTETAAVMAHPTMEASWTGFEPQQITAHVRDEKIGSIGWTPLPLLTETLGAPGMTIWQLGVANTFRRRGVSAALISRALRLAYSQHGARHACLGTQLWNAPAHAAYARFGFAPHALLIGRQRSAEETAG